MNRFTNMYMLFTDMFADVDIIRLATKRPVFANQ